MLVAGVLPPNVRGVDGTAAYLAREPCRDTQRATVLLTPWSLVVASVTRRVNSVRCSSRRRHRPVLDSCVPQPIGAPPSPALARLAIRFTAVRPCPFSVRWDCALPAFRERISKDS